MSARDTPSAPVTCLHLDRTCVSWEACANRTAKDSGKRAGDLIEYAKELARVRELVATIEKLADDAEVEERAACTALDEIMRLAREALSQMPMHIVPYPAEGP